TSSDPFAPGATLRRRRPTASAAARPATSSRNPAGSSAWNSSRTLSRSRARCGPSSIADPSRIRIVSNTPIAGSGRISADTAALWRGRLADFKPGRRQASEPGSASAPVFGRGAGARAGLRSCDVPAVKTLLIDNYDSFTYNLFQLLAEVNGDEPHVVRNDAAPWAELERLPFDNVVISPGPGRPERQGDFGICGEAIAQARVPLLGVCLGHQGLSSIHGGSVSPAAEAMHGRVSTVRHDGSPLFEGIPPDFQAVRYHSLVVAEPLPEPLEAIAWTRDGTVMAVRHRTRPQWGVQFHPESVCTEHGRALLANFRDLTRRFAARSGTVGHGRPTSGRSPRAAGARPAVAPGPSPGPLVADPAKLVVKVRRLDTLYDAERSFVHLYGANETAFWLDSSKVDERARFSYMGAAGGPLSAVIHYDVGEGELRLERADRTTEILKESIFDFLSREMRGLRQLSPELPFDFNGGFVGYFGYELKADCEGDAAHSSSMPDAAFVFADRLIAFDHLER